MLIIRKNIVGQVTRLGSQTRDELEEFVTVEYGKNVTFLRYGNLTQILFLENWTLL